MPSIGTRIGGEGASRLGGTATLRYEHAVSSALQEWDASLPQSLGILPSRHLSHVYVTPTALCSSSRKEKSVICELECQSVSDDGATSEAPAGRLTIYLTSGVCLVQ
jgi:hypothetical protein